MGGGGTDVGLIASGSSSASSGLQGNNRFGDLVASGLKLPEWVWLAALGVALILGVGFIFRK